MEFESTETPLAIETVEFAKIPLATRHDPMKRYDPVREVSREPVDMLIARSDMTRSSGQSDDHPGQAIGPGHDVCVRKSMCETRQRIRSFATSLSGYQHDLIRAGRNESLGDSLGAQEGATCMGVSVDDHVLVILASTWRQLAVALGPWTTQPY